MGVFIWMSYLADESFSSAPLVMEKSWQMRSKKGLHQPFFGQNLPESYWAIILSLNESSDQRRTTLIHSGKRCMRNVHFVRKIYSVRNSGCFRHGAFKTVMLAASKIARCVSLFCPKTWLFGAEPLQFTLSGQKSDLCCFNAWTRAFSAEVWQHSLTFMELNPAIATG